MTALEVVTTLGSTDERRAILTGWLNHRAALRAIGFDRGFQWLDGSFVEQKDPQDLDVVTFLYRPPGIVDPNQLAMLMRANLNLFGRVQVKAAYKLDFFACGPERIAGSPRQRYALLVGIVFPPPCR